VIKSCASQNPTVKAVSGHTKDHCCAWWI